jgi:hypothetical protein
MSKGIPKTEKVVKLDPDLKYIIDETVWTSHMKAAVPIMTEYNQKLREVIKLKNSEEKENKRLLKSLDQDGNAALTQEYREIFLAGL